MRVWACKVVSGEFVRGQLHASHCLHRMGGMGALQQIQTLDGCMTQDGGMGDPDIGLKHKMPLHFLLSVFSSMLR